MITENKQANELDKKQVNPVGGNEVPEVANTKTTKTANTFILFTYAVLIFLGIGTGYVLNNSMNTGTLAGNQKVTMTNSDKVVGLNDAATFKDSAEGIMETGGVDGEGTHRLTREGGPSQTIALVSSVLDLDEYNGKKVKIWGQTFPPQKAGWFMDVGKIELLE